MRMLRTTNMSSRSFTNVHLTAYPSFSYLSPVVRPSMRASRMSELTGEAGDEASWDAAGVNERDQRTTPPVNNSFDYIEGVIAQHIYLCGRLSNGRASCVVPVVLSGIEVVVKVGKVIGRSGDVLATASPSIYVRCPRSWLVFKARHRYIFISLLPPTVSASKKIQTKNTN